MRTKGLRNSLLGGYAMKKHIVLILIMIIAGCTHEIMPARQELYDYTPTGSILEKYDLAIGIEFVNQVNNKTTKLIEGDLATELSIWFVEYLEDNEVFKEVVNLNTSYKKDLDVKLKGVIKSLNVHDPGVSGVSSALGFFWGVAPTVEHYFIEKDIESTATVQFQLINPVTNELLWNTSITESATKTVTLSELSRTTFASLTKTISTLVSEPSFKKHLAEMHSKHLIAKLPEEKMYAIDKSSETAAGVDPIRRWAVVIGISNYKHPSPNGLANLIFADDDARAFARTLRNLGWSNSHIKLMLNKQATKRNIDIALESWLTKAGPNDQIVLFWAGHGYSDPEDPEKVYFACYDTDINIPATGYRMDRIRSVLEERKARNVIVLADTCHAGKLITRGGRGMSIVPQINKMHREQKTPKGWIFMVGADTDRKAIEHSSWKNGAFTHCLVNALSGKADGYLSSGPKDGIVTMGELRSYMNTAMPDETQKVLGVAKRPVIATSTGDPDIWNLTLQAKQHRR